MYLEPWHSDVFEFLDLKKNHGKEEMRARDLFYALWTPDLFMKRVKEDGMWTLMDPNESPGLCDCYGEEFEKLYTRYEEEGKGPRPDLLQESALDSLPGVASPCSMNPERDAVQDAPQHKIP